MMGKKWGILGILLATTISRSFTQVWFDPYLIYKRVFKKTSKPYFICYFFFIGITAASGIIALAISNTLKVSNMWFDFGLKAIIAIIVPNLLVVCIYHNTDEYAYVKSMLTRLFRYLKAKIH